MQGGFFTYGLLALLAIALLIAAFTDMRRRQIDNWLNLAIAIGAPLFWVAMGLTLTEVGYQLGIALVAFAVLAGIFALGGMGGGDVKLLTALALWIQPLWFLKLLIVMAILGGILTVFVAGWHVARRKEGKIAIPYGIAIACAGLWVIGSEYLPALQKNPLLG